MAEAGNEGRDRFRTPQVTGARTTFRAFFKRGGPKAVYQDVAKEMRQTTWPTTQETWRLTGVVLAVITIATVYLFVIDTVMTYVMHFIMKGP